ncbi:MAG TPA: hypothetical protein VHE81_12390 [Lacipirellulaceae bacterium]|jgi:hypothetical protein|nr:hypothetical protein [Lacipirellulaceae bacterium]
MSTPALENPRSSALTQQDLEFLAKVYESAAANYSLVDEETQEEVARMLLQHYRAGQRERYLLVSLAESMIGHRIN